MRLKYAISLLSWVLALSASQAHAWNPLVLAPICGQPSSRTLTTYPESAFSIAADISHTIGMSVTEIWSKPYIRDWISSVQPAQICVSAAILGHDSHGLPELLVNIVAAQPSLGRDTSLPLIFHETAFPESPNPSLRPWLGFPFSILAHEYYQATKDFPAWTTIDLPSRNPLTIAPLLFPARSLPVSEDSLGIVWFPGVSKTGQLYLVTQSRSVESADPFHPQYFVEGAWVALDDMSTSAHFLVQGNVGDLLAHLEEAQAANEPLTRSRTNDLKRLLEITTRPYFDTKGLLEK